MVNACKFAIKNYDKTDLNNNNNYKKNNNKIKNKSKPSDLKKSVTIILENNTGKKNSIGSKSDELAIILDKLRFSIDLRTHSFGICLDTCHAFAAGYDLRTNDKYMKHLIF